MVAKIRVVLSFPNAIAFIINNVFDPAAARKEPDIRVLEVDAAACWCRDGVGLPDFVISEEGVDSNAIAVEVGD